MTQDEFRRDILLPFIDKHGLPKAAALLEMNKGYLSRVANGRRPVTAKLAAHFGQTLTGEIEKSPYNSAKQCLDCHTTTYHRRVYMEQFPGRRAVQCKECRVITIDLKG